MTISALHENEKLRQKEFPVCKETIFLAHAAVAPLPARATEAIAKYSSDCVRGDQEEVLPKGILDQTRKQAAGILGCSSEEIALVGPTSTALSLVARGLDWKAGDNVVFYHQDYPSNVFPWMMLAEKGVELREIQPARMGEITLKDVLAKINKKTKLVSLASAHFISGHLLPVDQIGETLRERGILFCVDGIQTMGAIQTSVKHVDFLAADSHKWMVGPCAAGIFYVRRESQEKLKPTLLGWHNIFSEDFVAPEKIDFRPGAKRYEAGSHNLLGIVGMNASFSLLLDYGIPEIEKTIIGHVRFLREGLLKKDFKVSNFSENLSGIISFYKEGVDMTNLHRKLSTAGVHASLRCAHGGQRWIRFSPHFYNTRSELEQVLTKF